MNLFCKRLFFFQVKSRKSSEDKKQAISEYDARHLQSQDAEDTVSPVNLTLIEKVNDLQDRKLIGMLIDMETYWNFSCFFFLSS